MHRYHLLFLPALLLQMEVGACTGTGALLGTLDQATLVVTSMAVCGANWVCPRRLETRAAGAGAGDAARVAANEASTAKADRISGWRAASINWWYGDFIEAVYPLFEREGGTATYSAALIGAAAAGAAAVRWNIKSSAYLPVPLSVVLASSPAGAACVYGLQFLPPFLVELGMNVASWR